MATKQAAILVLADGTCYSGYAFGASGTAIGEVVFNTGMTGYQEVITDPSYRGQIVTFTCPELGNTGVNPEDEESDRPQVRGVIARNITVLPSNWRSRQTLPDYLKAHNVVGISGIDTRALTRKLRSLGAMNGGISTEILDPQALLAKVKSAPSMQGLNLAQEASTDRIYEWTEKTLTQWEFVEPAQLSGDTLTVVAIDFGVKKNILRRLASYGCRVIVVPANTPAETILAYNPDGIFLSNGPGDPAAVTDGIATAKVLLEANKPMFGICLGHQLLALAHEIPTFKMHHGHRGLNHPVKNLQTGKSEITTQNHGFGVDPEAVRNADHIEITHINLNDDSIEGIRIKGKPFFSVQYHPEATPGPHDSRYLFDDFIALMN